MSKNKFTGTATQPQRNRTLCQFNKDQYCNSVNAQQTHGIQRSSKEGAGY